MFVNFSEETRHLLKQAEKEREDLRHPYVGSEHLFLSILRDSKLVDLLKKHKVTYDRFKNKLIDLIGIGSKKSDFILYTPLLKRVLENAVIEAREENNKIVNPEIVIISILDEKNGVAYTILKSLNVNFEKIYHDLKNKKDNKNLRKRKLLIEELGTDLTKLAKEKKLDPVIGRNVEIKKAIEILLRRKKNNPILIGPAGVGKTAIVEGIANLIVSDACPSFLKEKRIISLNIFSLVSGTKYRGEFEEKMKTLIKELEDNKDIILFIDEIHTMVGAGGAEGAIDASNIFKPALARGNIRIIGATTLDEYKKYIEPDAALARRFQSVNIEEPDKNDVIKILMGIKPLYEKFHNIKITNELIKEIVFLSSKYLTNRYEPDRSIDVLDEVCAKTSVRENEAEKKYKQLKKELQRTKKSKIKVISDGDFKTAYELKAKENRLTANLNKVVINEKIVSKKDVLEVIKNKSNIKSLGISKERKKFYKLLENKLNDVLIGQNKAVKELIKSLIRKELLKTKKTYSVLITGESSSGKTLLATTFLKNVVGENNIIKLDLSEYKEYHTITKLIGTTAGYIGYDNKNNVFEKIRTNPSSALLIDNFEMASSEVQNLFLKILKSGIIEDASGKKIDFTNTYVIFTTTIKKENNPVGFENKKINDLSFLPKNFLDSISTKIKLENINDSIKNKIVLKKIKDIKEMYSNINIEITDDYKQIIKDKIKTKTNFQSVVKKVEKDLEEQIIDALISYKKNIRISKEKLSDVAS